MVETICVCRERSSEETFPWEFYVDKNMTASFINLEEDLRYEDLLKIEDFVYLIGFIWSLFRHLCISLWKIRKTIMIMY